MKTVCQSFMALMVWAIGQYDKSDAHFRAKHSEKAVENAQLMQAYIVYNEMWLDEKEKYAREGKGMKRLLKARNRFMIARTKLNRVLKENE